MSPLALLDSLEGAGVALSYWVLDLGAAEVEINPIMWLGYVFRAAILGYIFL